MTGPGPAKNGYSVKAQSKKTVDRATKEQKKMFSINFQKAPPQKKTMSIETRSKKTAAAATRQATGPGSLQGPRGRPEEEEVKEEAPNVSESGLHMVQIWSNNGPNVFQTISQIAPMWPKEISGSSAFSPKDVQQVKIFRKFPKFQDLSERF